MEPGHAKFKINANKKQGYFQAASALFKASVSFACLCFCAFLGSCGYALVLLLFCLIFSEQFCAFGKMATSSRKRIRYSFDIHFCSLEEKDSFLLKLKVARQKLTQEGSPLLDNYSLFSALLDKKVADLLSPSICNEEQW